MPKKKQPEKIVPPTSESTSAEAAPETATSKVDSEEPKSERKSAEKNVYFANGRRKTATARARLYLSSKEVIINGQKLAKGDVYVNDLPIEKYFPDPFARAQYTEVFRTTNTAGRFITTVHVEGSGKSGQLGATILAIARALCLVDPKFKPILRKKGFMTRDPRAREREKPGLMGARKQKQSPKR